ncbi:RluA family pseudouridine synthase [Nonlabens ponticola]|uniref:RluA family pseudouridine synthase n=1 Tax=Nonlabens ponticola TaxID=2496866 RepID=A0A3S9MZA5_9FLAO|nr:RluA family pseudouridine synthase [Nonlabens ponticola]AZQ44585.1 RluA family pseudouridine synthase [Nonlabens ponticola]
MDQIFHEFEDDVSHITLPEKFNFPFYYEPHELAVKAASELQDYLSKQPWFTKGSAQESGKMFGVLVVKRDDDSLGFLASFSGKLAGETTQPYFVPPVYELERVDQFFKLETDKLDALTAQLQELENDPASIELIRSFESTRSRHASRIEQEQLRIKRIKRERRKFLRSQEAVLNAQEFEQLTAQQRQLSLNNNFFLREYEEYLDQTIQPLEKSYSYLIARITDLKTRRRDGSNWLQDWLFDQYNFLNGSSEVKNVKALFKNRTPDMPPAGTGDCAAPKLLQYAYQHNFTPITMAEFWYGPSPASKIRKHGNYYPACRSKCEPVLEFMLHGLAVDDNPLLENPAVDKELEIIYEDQHMLAIVKPAEFLSVPGKTISDCVQSRMKAAYPDATGPMIVHRLDMSTSGIMLIAKTLEAYHHLQQQFIKRTITKRYTAVLVGVPKKDNGFIDLPMRVDLDNRPYQLVDHEYGKSARTKYKVIGQSDKQTLIHFFPITGRTHQLRVHAAHRDGLNAPIKGDDLYGTTSDRMYLHADRIVFVHPASNESIVLESPSGFGV